MSPVVRTVLLISFFAAFPFLFILLNAQFNPDNQPAAVIIIFFICGLIILFGLAAFSGWRELARHYPLTQTFQGEKLSRQSLCLTNKWFINRGTMTIGINTKGIYLKPAGIFSFGSPPIFIPFEEINRLEKDTFPMASPPEHLVKIITQKSPHLPLWITARFFDTIKSNINKPLT